MEVAPKDKVEIKDNEIDVQVPAHTISVNIGIECVYDLSKGESPMITTRPIALKSSFAEIIWIYLWESNDLVEYDKILGYDDWDGKPKEERKIHNWWEQWALRNPDGSYKLNEKGHPYIGSTYGEIIRKRNMLFREVIDQIRNNPDGRRNISCMWQIDDFDEEHGLKPCAYETIWNVRRGWDGVDYLDMTLIQRSSDFVTAGCINQVEYAALLLLVAKELNLTPGFFTWKPVNVQIYDRHFDQGIELLNREPVNCEARIAVTKEEKSIKDTVVEDMFIEDLPRQLIKTKNPQMNLDIGI